MRRRKASGAGASDAREARLPVILGKIAADASFPKTKLQAGRSAAPTQAPSIYVLRLQSPRGDDIRRVRLLLKMLLRSYQLRCLSVEEEPQP